MDKPLFQLTLTDDFASTLTALGISRERAEYLWDRIIEFVILAKSAREKWSGINTCLALCESNNEVFAIADMVTYFTTALKHKVKVQLELVTPTPIPGKN